MAKTMKREEIGPFLKDITDEFERVLAGLPASKKTKGDLIAGFKDGARSAFHVLREQGYLDVDASEAPGATSETGR